MVNGKGEEVGRFYCELGGADTAQQSKKLVDNTRAALDEAIEHSILSEAD